MNHSVREVPVHAAESSKKAANSSQKHTVFFMVDDAPVHIDIEGGPFRSRVIDCKSNRYIYPEIYILCVYLYLRFPCCNRWCYEYRP